MVADLRAASKLLRGVSIYLNKGHQRCGCGCPRCEHQVYKDPKQAHAWNVIKAMPGRLAEAADELEESSG